jgi:hypothetical protein
MSNEFEVGSRMSRGALALAGGLALVLAGCGGEQQVADKTEAPLRVPVEQTATVAAMTGAPASTPEEEVVASADSLPPEVAVEVMDHTVEPGEAIEITALGSPDVRDVVMSDGMGHSTAFVYDLPAKAWKAYYRVPMKHSGERLGLSVTAKNDGNRWRRVWLFLDIADPTVSTATDSTR